MRTGSEQPNLVRKTKPAELKDAKTPSRAADSRANSLWVRHYERHLSHAQSQLSVLTIKTQAEPPKKCACFVLTDGTPLLLILLGSYGPYNTIVSLSERLSNSETDE